MSTNALLQWVPPSVERLVYKTLTFLEQRMPTNVLLQLVTPYKSLSFLKQQISLSETVHLAENGRTIASILLLCTLGVYFTSLHTVFYFLPPSQVPLKALLVDFVWALGMSETFSIVVASNAALALYYFLVFYLDDACQPVHHLLGRLLFQAASPSTFRLPYKLKVIPQVANSHFQMFTWLALNAPQCFILSIDVGIPLIMFTDTVQFLPLLGPNGYFDERLGVATSWIAYLSLITVHLVHLLIYPIGFLIYAHVLILAFTYCTTLVGYLKYRVQVNVRKLKRALGKRRLHWASVDSVKSDMMSILKMTFLLDRAFSKLFLAFLLVNMPCSALLATLYLFNYQTIPLIAFAAIVILLAEQLGYTVGLHFWVAHSSKALHRVGALLLRLNVHHHQHRGGGNSRAHLRLDLLVACLHTKRKYGFTYGGLALVTMSTFGKCLLLYVEVLLYAYSFVKY